MVGSYHLTEDFFLFTSFVKGSDFSAALLGAFLIAERLG
jgi:hypothetical protein